MRQTPSDEERPAAAAQRKEAFRSMLDAADARDKEAERRDRLAEARDPATTDEQAAIDRIHAGRDRDAAAADREAFITRTEQRAGAGDAD